MDHRKTLRKRPLNPLLAGMLGAASLCVLCAASPARADDDRDTGSRRDRDGMKTHIAFDLDYNTAVDEPRADPGAGGALRLGKELDLFLISFTPELGGSYHGFGGDERTRIYSGFLGGRLAVGKILEPSIFGHVGVGHVSGIESRTAPSLDAGLALDFTLLPLIDLGVHGAYNVLLPSKDDPALKYLTLGAQAAIVL